jgi:hypothetical protein
MLLRRRKPPKPYTSFPLTPHGNGQWCKRIRGEIRFFGVWEDTDTALANDLQAAADLHSGRRPSPQNLHRQGFAVKDAR